jgi:hypothetical protein
MGLLSDLFLCHADQVGDLYIEESSLVMRDPRVEGVELKGLTGLQHSIMWAAIEGQAWSDAHSWETRTDPPWTAEQYERGEEPPYLSTIEWFPPETAAAFAGVKESDIPLLAHRLSTIEDFSAWSEEDLRWLLGEVSALAARADGRILCLWTSL